MGPFDLLHKACGPAVFTRRQLQGASRGDGVGEQLGQPAVVPAGVAVEACGHELAAPFVVEGLQIQAVAGVAGQVEEEHELRTGVALAEAVDLIHRAPVPRQAIDELALTEAGQVVLGGQAAVQVVGGLGELRSRVVAVGHRGGVWVATSWLTTSGPRLVIAVSGTTRGWPAQS